MPANSLKKTQHKHNKALTSLGFKEYRQVLNLRCFWHLRVERLLNVGYHFF